MSDTRQHLHDLIDQLPSTTLPAVAGLIEKFIDGDEERAVAEAKQWLREQGGKGISNEEVLADFDLTMDDFRRLGEQSAQRRG